MGKFYDSISEAHRKFVEDQHMFFVATAPLSEKGRVNLSPKGLDAFRVLGANQVGYMDLISSGNETSAHTLENGRITIMLCSYTKKPQILRFYGQGKAALRGSDLWNQYEGEFDILPSTRQLIIANIDLVQTSCGYGVPLFEYHGERSIHFDWAANKGEEGLKEYIKQKNLKSLDGLDTDIGLKIPT